MKSEVYLKGVGDLKTYSRGINDSDHWKRTNEMGSQLSGVDLQRQVSGG